MQFQFVYKMELPEILKKSLNIAKKFLTLSLGETLTYGKKHLDVMRSVSGFTVQQSIHVMPTHNSTPPERIRNKE